MTRIVVDPDELGRFAALSAQAADDYAARAASLRNLELVPMPPEVTGAVADGIARVASDVETLAGSLYAEATLLRVRASVLDPFLRRYLDGAVEPPG